MMSTLNVGGDAAVSVVGIRPESKPEGMQGAEKVDWVAECAVPLNTFYWRCQSVPDGGLRGGQEIVTELDGVFGVGVELVGGEDEAGCGATDGYSVHSGRR